MTSLLRSKRSLERDDLHSLVAESMEDLKTHYPRPLRLSEHPKLASLMETQREVFIDKIDTLFDAGFVDDFTRDDIAQVLVLRAVFDAKSLNDVPAKDTWYLFLPPKSTTLPHMCQIDRCDKTNFPQMSICLFHYEVRVAIERLLMDFEIATAEDTAKGRKMRSYPVDRLKSYEFATQSNDWVEYFRQYPYIFSCHRHDSFLGSLVDEADDAAFLGDYHEKPPEFHIPTLEAFRRDPLPTIQRFHRLECTICPILRPFRFRDYDVSKPLQNNHSEQERFCEKHYRQLRLQSSFPSADDTCNHRQKGTCHCLIESGQHDRCCHPCFVRQLYAEETGEPFPNFIGSDDILDLVLTYVRPNVWFGIVLNW